VISTLSAEIVTIGDELLIGQIVNTNAAWIAERLNEIGIPVLRMTTVGDDRDEILQSFRRAWDENTVVIVTGGLGPTHDDISKACVAEFFGRGLALNEEVLRQVEERFRKYGYAKMPEVNRGQALVPEGFTALANDRGTAPGLLLSDSGKTFVILPGVPFEMQGLMTGHVLPHLRQQHAGRLKVIRHRIILTTGIGESSLAEKIGDVKTFLPDGVTLAFLPSHGSVRLRISAHGASEEEVLELIGGVEEHIRSRAAKYIYGEDSDTLELSVVRLLAENRKTVATAESCTGGMVAARLTSIDGASAVMMGSIVAYDNAVKQNVLHVPENVLREHGAVSEESARAMAEGVRELLKTDYAVSVTGIAGPGGGTPEKPVGTVWIAVSSQDETTARLFHFADDREKNRERATVAALEMLRQTVLS
jgi:nicotinamide-nucleotide amidase